MSFEDISKFRVFSVTWSPLVKSLLVSDNIKKLLS